MARQTRPHKKPPGPKRAGSTPAAQARFLAALAELGTITHAANEAGINRQTHYNWLAADPEDYGARYREAEDQATDSLEREARRRAVDGTEEPVYQGGKLVGKIRKHSDVLLIFLLKGAKPEKYRERYEHTGPGGGPIKTETRDLSALSTVELSNLRGLLLKAKGAPA